MISHLCYLWRAEETLSNPEQPIVTWPPAIVKYLRTFATPSFCPHFLWHPGNQRPIKKCKYFCKTKLFSVFCWRQDLPILAAFTVPHTASHIPRPSRWKCDGGHVTFDPCRRHIQVIKTNSDAEETRASLERLSSSCSREDEGSCFVRVTASQHTKKTVKILWRKIFSSLASCHPHHHHPATGQQYDLLSNNVLLYVSSMCRSQPDPVTTNVHCGAQQHTGQIFCHKMSEWLSCLILVSGVGPV